MNSVTARPLITGSIMSRVTTSGRRCWHSSIPRLPSPAWPTISMPGSAADRKSTRLNSSHSLHDALPIYHGQHHVQGDDVRPQVLAQLDSALAVAGLANDFDAGIGCQHLQHALSNRQGILDHQNTCLRHGYPISVRMVSRSCPWSNSPLTK